MTNAERITTLRNCSDGMCSLCPYDDHELSTKGCEAKLMRDAADALEAADKRIEQLEKQEPTEKQVVDYCHKRCLVIVEEELFQRMKSTFAYMPKEGAWIQMNGHRYCNVCGHKDSPIMRNYCPNCGAKMRGANDE